MLLRIDVFFSFFLKRRQIEENVVMEHHNLEEPEFSVKYGDYLRNSI